MNIVIFTNKFSIILCSRMCDDAKNKNRLKSLLLLKGYQATGDIMGAMKDH